MRVSISAEHIAMPSMCVCCGAKPDQEFYTSATKTRGKKKITQETRSLAFPTCSTCMAHAKAVTHARRFMITFMVIGALISLYSFNPRNASIWILLLISGILFFSYGLSAGLGKLKKARALKRATCVGDDPRKLVSYVDWHSRTKVFEIKSEAFLFAFELMAAHRKKLVNMPIQILIRLDEYIQAKATISQTGKRTENTITIHSD